MADFPARRKMMVDTQVRPSDVTKFTIINAMLSVPREAFVPTDRREMAYVGEHLELGQGRVVLDPRCFSKMLDVLDITPDDVVLDVGCNLGYSTAVIACMAETVIGIEEDDAAADTAQVVLSENGYDNAAVLTGTLTDGAAKAGPFDVIIVQGGVAQMPATLLDQLKDGGRIAAIFMDGALGEVRIGFKLDGEVTWRFSFNASAPLLPGFEKHAAFAL